MCLSNSSIWFKYIENIKHKIVEKIVATLIKIVQETKQKISARKTINNWILGWQLQCFHKSNFIVFVYLSNILSITTLTFKELS